MIAVSTLLLAAGIAQVARRLLSPAPRKAPRVSRQMTALQSLRLMLPAATALAVGLFAGSLLVTAQEAARLPVARAVSAAGVDVQPAIPFANPAAVESEPADTADGAAP